MQAGDIAVLVVGYGSSSTASLQKIQALLAQSPQLAVQLITVKSLKMFMAASSHSDWNDLNWQAVDAVILDGALLEQRDLMLLRHLVQRYSQIPFIIIGTDTKPSTELATTDAMLQAGVQDIIYADELAVDADGHRLQRRIHHAIARQQRQTRSHSDPLSSSSNPLLSEILALDIGGILLVDTQGTIQWVNPQAEAILRRPAQELIGEAFGLPLSAQDSVVLNVIDPDFHQDHILIHAEMHVIETQWQGKTVSLVLLRDVTFQKQAEAIVYQQAVFDRLSSAAHIVRNVSDFPDILHRAVIEVQGFLQADRVMIGQLQGENLPTIKAEAAAAGWGSRQSTLPHCYFDLDQFHLRHQRPVLAWRDLESHPSQPRDRKILQALQVQASLVAPIFQDDRLWAVLIVHQCNSPRYWENHEIDFLCRLTGQIENSLYQASLYNQLQRLNQKLGQQVEARTAELKTAFQFEATLQRIIEKVRDSLDEEQILHTAVRELVQAIDATGCNASLYDSDKSRSTIRYEYATSGVSYVGRVLQLDAFPEIYGQLMGGETFQFCSLLPNLERGRTAILTSPIYDDQGSIGDLWLVHDSDHAFNPQHIRLVQQVASQCAIAIRQARLYQASQAQVRELDKINRLKDDFISTVSHELRTPIASIRMATHMLQIRLQSSGVLNGQPSSISQYLQVLQDECQREIRLINDLLDLSRLEAGRETLQFTPIDLKTWLPRTTESFREQAKSRQQEFVIHIPPRLPMIETDPAQLEPILMELLNNAYKYTPSGEEIAIDAAVVENQLQLCVSNSGVEISPAEQEQIFQKFYRIPNSDPWKYGGTGLGLALVKTRVEWLGGNIQVESGSGKTEFLLTFPIRSQVANEPIQT